MDWGMTVCGYSDVGVYLFASKWVKCTSTNQGRGKGLGFKGKGYIFLLYSITPVTTY